MIEVAKVPGLSPDELSDEVIVARVLSGERGLFELLMRRNNRRLYRAVRGILGGVAEGDIDDVVQEAYVRAFVHLGSFAGRSRFSTWLTRIAVYEALARRRHHRTETLTSDPHDTPEDAMVVPTEPVSTPERELASAELRRVIERTIDALPEHYRVVFVLRAVEELSVAETAECLEIPEDTVKTRLHRARGLLQHQLVSQLDTAAHEAFHFDGARCDRIVAAVLSRIVSLSPRPADSTLD